MKPNKPLLIVLTPVFNEAWILPAFLKATSLWADYIIIADQMSTDGSRELYDAFRKEAEINFTPSNPNKHHCQLIIVDNPRKEMHQAATRRLLFEEAKKIEGDKILFTLDADEFLSGNFPATEGWKTIMNSEPGDVFEFNWMLLSSDGKSYRKQNKEPFYWAAHVNDEIMSGKFPDNFIDEWRLPWPEHVNHEYVIEDISFLHFHDTNTLRQRNKTLFYQILQYSHPTNTNGGIYFNRRYNAKHDYTYLPLPQDAYAFYEAHGLNLWENLNLNDGGAHYEQVVRDKIQEKGVAFFRKLDIWNADFVQKYHLKDPRRPIDKLMHWYMRKTQGIADTKIIRGLDKLLKLFY